MFAQKNAFEAQNFNLIFLKTMIFDLVQSTIRCLNCSWCFKEDNWPLRTIGQQATQHQAIVGNDSGGGDCFLRYCHYYSVCVVLMLFCSLVGRMVLIVFTIYIYQKSGYQNGLLLKNLIHTQIFQETPCFCFFCAKTFRSILLRRFGHWNISAICLTVVLKLATTVFFSLYFQTFWQKWQFFRSFQKRFGLWP